MAAGVPEEPLAGGRVTPGVVRVGETVRRPRGAGSAFAADVLRHLERVGFDGAPRFLGPDEQGRDVLSFVPGDVPPELGSFTDDQLAEAFALLRRFHDALAGSSLAGAAETVCHGDVSPCNTILRDGRPVALIDFDTAGPGRRVDDLGYGLFLWLDLRNEHVSLDEQRRRLELAAAAYGVPVEPQLVAAIVRQVAINVERLREAGRERDLAWWSAMHAWLLAHAAALGG